MKYILEGNEKDVSNVLKEQRIRMSRGLISITPISECGLITEEDARKTMEELALSVENKEELISTLTKEHEETKSHVSKLETVMNEKDALILSLTTERDGLLARVLALEATGEDKKELPAGDSKELPVGDTKATDVTDDKTVIVEEKKRGRPAARKTE